MLAGTKTRSPADRERAFLKRLLRLQEAQGDVEDWSFSDACRWLALDTRRTWGQQLAACLLAFEQRLDACSESLGERKVRKFQRVYEAVRAGFSQHFTLLLKRRVREDA